MSDVADEVEHLGLHARTVALVALEAGDMLPRVPELGEVHELLREVSREAMRADGQCRARAGLLRARGGAAEHVHVADGRVAPAGGGAERPGEDPVHAAAGDGEARPGTTYATTRFF